MLPACNEVYKRTQEYNKPINTTKFKNYVIFRLGIT